MWGPAGRGPHHPTGGPRAAASFAAQQPEHNEVVAGQWRPEERGAVSVEEGIASTLGLILLGLLWELWLAPTGSGTLAIKVLPLCIPLAGLLKNRMYTYRWVSLLVWLYFTEGIVRATSSSGLVVPLAWTQVLLCVLLTVPMALIGVFLIYFFTNASFTREAFIGVIMMGGVVTNNATLLVDHINQLRRAGGLPLREAIHRGTLERVRPILMTSAVTILGLLPLVVMSKAADANIWNALGYALLGGLASSTILVLTVTPALYLLFERGPERRRLARLAAQAERKTVAVPSIAPAPVPGA